MKKGSLNLPLVLLAVFATICMLGIVYAIISLIGPNYDKEYEKRIEAGEFEKPKIKLVVKEKNLTASSVKTNISIAQEEVILGESNQESFDSLKEIAEYSAVQSKAYNLHAPLFTQNYPKIEIHVEDNTFGATIIDGEIEITTGSLTEEDIVVYTTAEEINKIVEDISYAKESYENGDTTIKIKSSKTELALKGYLNLYNELNKKN